MGQLLCGMPPNHDFLIITLWEIHFWEESTEIKYHHNHMTSSDLSLLMLTLVTQLEVMFVRVLSCKAPLLFSISTVSLEETHHVHSTFK